MATYTPAGSTPILNRRHGVVFSTQGSQLTVRSLAIPVQPKPPATVRATQAFSAGASMWQALSPTFQAMWNATAVSPDTGVSLFIAYSQLLQTWGSSLSPIPIPPGITLSPVPFVGGTQDSMGRNCINIFCYDLPDTPHGSYAMCYWAPNYARAVAQPDTADPGFNTGLPTPVYEYFGMLGPLVNGIQNLFRIDQVTQARLGYTPAPPSYDSGRHLITATVFAMYFYWITFPPPWCRRYTAPTFTSHSRIRAAATSAGLCSDSGHYPTRRPPATPPTPLCACSRCKVLLDTGRGRHTLVAWVFLQRPP